MSKMKELHYDLTIAAEENTQLGHAARYLLNGWAVMPLKPKSKEPHFDLINKAYLSATTDWEMVKFWFQCDPNANVGIACKPSSARITIGFGNVAANVVFPRPESPMMVTITERSFGLLMVDNNDINCPPLSALNEIKYTRQKNIVKHFLRKRLRTFTYAYIIHLSR